MSRFRIREKNWVLVVLIGWAIIFAWSARFAVMPTWWWFDVQSIHVEDTIAGTPPRMDVVRTINRGFDARWRVEVERMGIKGFSFFCGQTSANDYSPDNELPYPLDLNWWTWPRECNLLPGTYRVITTWWLDPEDGRIRTRRVRKVSNTFSVRPPPH